MRYLLARTGQACLLLAGVSLLSFVFVQLAPGDFFSEMRLNPQISQETVQHLQRQFALDRPASVRYLHWLRGLVHGDFGFSFAYNSPVRTLLMPRAGNTLLLTSIATLIAWSIAIPLGVRTAATPRGLPARVCSLVTATLLATPDLVLALITMMFAVRSGWIRSVRTAPSASGSFMGWQNMRDALVHLALPTFVLTLTIVPTLLRHTAAAMRDALSSSCISAARAHGIGPSQILYRHALRVAINPIVTLLGTSLGSLLSASLMVEVAMGWPGIGPLLLEAILSRDLFVVIGGIVLSAVFLISGTLVADVLLFVVDPRIRTEGLA